jgi:protein TonB
VPPVAESPLPPRADIGSEAEPARAPAAARLPAPQWPLALHRRDEISGAERRALVLLVTAAHVLAAWGLLQLQAVRDAVREVAPLVVDLVAPPAPEPARPAPAPPPQPRPVLPPPPAPMIAAALAPVPAPETFTTPAPPPEPPPIAAAPQPAPAPPAPPAPPPPPPRRVVAATAVQYLVLPPVEVPRLSRRAGESGTVWLRVVVDVRGHPLQVSVQQSSGFARLDEQALWAMRQARFKPQTENGQPIELEVSAPIEYALE